MEEEEEEEEEEIPSGADQRYDMFVYIGPLERSWPVIFPHVFFFLH